MINIAVCDDDPEITKSINKLLMKYQDERDLDFTVDVLNEGICFFLFHQPPFPENARKMKEHKEEEENGKNSRFTN